MAKLLCMEIGAGTIRVAEVIKKNKKLEVLKTFVFDAEDDTIKDGKIRVTDSVVANIRNGLDLSGIEANDVYFVADSSRILFKQIELPFMQKRMIQGTLELSLSDYFPIDDSMYHVSYTLEGIYDKNNQKMMGLNVYAIPNDLSESYYNLAVALGLNAKGLSGAGKSILSLFPSSFKDRNLALVNINENQTTITFARNNEMLFNKTFEIGVANTIKEVQNSSLSLEDLGTTEAIEFLYTQNILLPKMPDGVEEGASQEDRLRYSATTSIGPLLSQIEHTLIDFLKKNNLKIQGIALSGIGAGFAGISQLFAHKLDVPVSVVQQDSSSLTINPEAADDILLIASYPSIGSILDQSNFFTLEEQAGGELAHKKKVDHMFIFGGALVCLAAFGYSSWTLLKSSLAYQDAKGENVRLTKRVQELKDLGVEKAYNEYTTTTSYHQEVNNLYNETKSGNEDMSKFLEEMEKVLPPTARATAITLTPKTADVSFIAEDKFVAAGVLHKLRNMKSIHSMDCPGVAEVENTKEITFQCKFNLKSTEEREPKKEDKEDKVNKKATTQEQVKEAN